MDQRTHGEATHDPPPLWVDLAETLFLAAAVVYVLLAVSAVLNPSRDPQDFGAFYESAAAWRSGGDPYARSGAALLSPNLNPPLFAVLFSPIASLTIREGLFLWWAVNIASLGAALAIIGRELSWRPSRRMILFGIAFAGTQAQLSQSQLSWICLLLATLSWRAWRREHSVLAGFWMGALIGLKPIFLPVLGVAILRDKRPLLLTALGVILLSVLLGALACGWSAYASWLQAGGSVQWFAAFLNASVRGVLARLFANDSVTGSIWVLASLSVAAVAVWQLTRHPSSPDQDLAVGFLTSLLVSPLGWVYYIPVALGPLLATLRGVQRRWWMYLGLAGLCWPLGVGWPSLDKQLEPGLWNGCIGSLYAAGLFTLWCLSLQGVRQPAADPNSEPVGTPETRAVPAR
jgi:hypothetical protein